MSRRRIEPLGVLQHPLRLQIYAAMSRADAPRIAELARRAGLKPSSVRWHLHKMQRAGLVAEEQVDGKRYRVASTPESRLATAITMLTSLPARELLAQIERTPGLHLQQLADALQAPRSRYWRIVQALEAQGLVRPAMQRRARLLFATELGLQALQAVRLGGIDPRPKTRRSVPEFPSLIIYPQPRGRKARRSRPGSGNDETDRRA
jgi:DNA-binding MarR family transcriptional regulator